MGLVRMVQTGLSPCVIEATVDRLPGGEYSINIHELGDISQGGDRYVTTTSSIIIGYVACIMHSCGELYCLATEVPPAGKLGSLVIDETGTGQLHMSSEQLRLSDVVGRSIVVSTSGDNKRYLVINN